MDTEDIETQEDDSLINMSGVQGTIQLIATLVLWGGVAWFRGLTDTSGLFGLFLEPSGQGLITLFIWLGELGFWLFVAMNIAGGIRLVPEWEEMPVFTLGKLTHTAKPGFNFVWPIFQEGRAIDTRLVTEDIDAAQVLTLDNISVGVEATVFYKVTDFKKALLGARNYVSATMLAAEVALREAVAQNTLAGLQNREELANKVLAAVSSRTADWGVTVTDIGITDITIPEALQEAMSQKAQAEQQAAARAELATVAVRTAQLYREAAEVYGDRSLAPHLRAMEIAYEAATNGATTILMPTSAMDAMAKFSLPVALAGQPAE